MSEDKITQLHPDKALQRQVETLQDQVKVLLNWKQETSQWGQARSQLVNATIPDGCDLHDKVIVWARGNTGRTLIRTVTTAEGDREVISAFASNKAWRDEERPEGYVGPLIVASWLNWEPMVPTTVIIKATSDPNSYWIKAIENGKRTKQQIRRIFWGMETDLPPLDTEVDVLVPTYLASKLRLEMINE